MEREIGKRREKDEIERKKPSSQWLRDPNQGPLDPLSDALPLVLPPRP